VSTLALPGRGARLGARRLLARLGRGTRRRLGFGLMVAALSFGVVLESLRPATWRRTVRSAFRRALHQAIAGSVAPTLVTAGLVGMTMVEQALYWQRELDQAAEIRSLLVSILAREVCPILVGLILLGRSGTVAIAEIGALKRGGQIRALEGQGLDPFLLLLLPRASALSVAAFTLGMVFVVTALLGGFALATLTNVAQISIGAFLERVMLDLGPPEFIALSGEMLLIGILVALTSGLTGLTAEADDDVASLLPRGFVRGVLMVLLVNAVLGLVV